MTEHQKLDQDESHETEQAKRIQQSLDTLNKAADKIEDFLENNEPRQGQGKSKKEVKSNITDNESAKMTTSKGTIQGYNGVATVDKKHQIVIDAQAFGAGPEQPTLQPILKTIKERYNRLKINDDIYKAGAIVTADTGFANEDNMEYLHTENTNVPREPSLVTKLLFQQVNLILIPSVIPPLAQQGILSTQSKPEKIKQVMKKSIL